MVARARLHDPCCCHRFGSRGRRHPTWRTAKRKGGHGMNGLVIGATDLLARPAAGGDATVCALIAIALLGALLVRREVRRASVGANGGRELRLLQVAIA